LWRQSQFETEGEKCFLEMMEGGKKQLAGSQQKDTPRRGGKHQLGKDRKNLPQGKKKTGDPKNERLKEGGGKSERASPQGRKGEMAKWEGSGYFLKKKSARIRSRRTGTPEEKGSESKNLDGQDCFGARPFPGDRPTRKSLGS